jgi:prepilin-type N-terminal cleavage/methylation domain-containing protein
MKSKIELPCGSRGFTLIELITTIAVLTLLVGLSVPAYQAVRKKVDLKNCNQNKYIIWKTYQNEKQLDDNVTLKDIIRDNYFLKGQGRQSGLYFNQRITCNDENYVYTGETESAGYVPSFSDIHCNYHEGRLADGADLMSDYSSVYSLFTPATNITGTVSSGGSYSQTSMESFLNSNLSQFNDDQRDILQDAIDRGLLSTSDGAESVISDLQAAGEDDRDYELVMSTDESGEVTVTFDFSNMNYGDGTNDLSAYVTNGSVDVSGIKSYMQKLYDDGTLNDAQKAAYEAYGNISKADAAVRAYLAIVKYNGQMPYFETADGQKIYVSQTLQDGLWGSADAESNIVTIGQTVEFSDGTKNVKYVYYDGAWYEWVKGDSAGNGQYQYASNLASSITDTKKWKKLDPQPTIVDPNKTN